MEYSISKFAGYFIKKDFKNVQIKKKKTHTQS